MATFVKCKEEFVKRKRTKQEQTGTELETIFLFFKRVKPIYIEVFDCEDKIFNNPVNLDAVLDIEKIVGAGDTDSNYSGIAGTSKPGIRFYFNSKCLTDWFYSDEKVRDEQFEEIASNSHLYKSKVVL